MNQNSFKRQSYWIFLSIIAVTIIFFPNMKARSKFFSSKDNNVINLPSPQSDSMYVRFGTSWGGPNTDYAEDVWTDENEYIYVCGTLDRDTESPKLILSKFNRWLIQDWNITLTMGTGTLGKAIWGNSENIYTAGVFANHLFLIKWSVGGIQIWNRTWSLGEYFGDVHSIWGIGDDIYLSGVYIDDLLLVKWSEEGDQQWNKTWGNNGWEEAFDIWGIDNEIYTCGSTSSYGAGLNDSVIVKWDSNGNQIWNRTSGTSFVEHHTSIFGYNASVYVCGNSWSNQDSSSDILIMKWDGDGNQIWNQTWGQPENDNAYSIWANEYYVHVSGTTLGWDAPIERSLLAKYSFNGGLVETSFPTGESETHYIPKSIFGYNHNVYMCGWHNGSLEIPEDYDQFLFRIYSFNILPAPYVNRITPNPSEDGNFLISWEKVIGAESYNLYRDIHPIQEISSRVPYQKTTDISYQEIGLEEGTYFYIVTSNVKNYESEMSIPRIVNVDLPDPVKKIPGYDIVLMIALIGFTTIWMYKRPTRTDPIK